MRTDLLLILTGIVSGITAMPLTAQSQTLSEQKKFEVAPGYSFEPIALSPLTKWPVLVDWDSKGHLLVVESGGVAHPILEHNRQALHRLVRLIDEDGNGAFDRRELVAEGLPFTEGVLCLGSYILVSAPPVIYRLSDPDGDGQYEQREVWFDGQTLTGCANDLHGPYLGRDGWVYWCKGAFAEQKHELLGGGMLTDKAAHIYRRKISGGPIEPVMSGGMDNPVGFAMLPNGERFFSSTFLVHPGDGLRDGVVHSIYGGTYGKDHAALDGVIRTGPLMPVMALLGAAAPSGMICLTGEAQPEATQPALIVTLFNHRKLLKLSLLGSDSTYRCQPVDLVVGNRIDFHPTDVLQDLNGSLIVVDTGGWYDLCCPSSRVDQELAAGGIYRLTPPHILLHHEASQEPQRAVDFSPERAVELLDDKRPWIARRALLEVAESGDRFLHLLQDKVKDPQITPLNRCNALWALGATGTQSAMAIVTDLIHAALLPTASEQPPRPTDAELDLLHIACHLVSLHRYRAARDDVQKILHGFSSIKLQNPSPASIFPTPALARVAAETLGRIGDADSVRILFDSFEHIKDDRVLDHSVRYALFELGESNSVARFLNSHNSKHRELALSTLDLLKADSYLTAEVLVKAAGDQETQPTAIRLLLKRPQLASDAIRILGDEWLKELNHSAPPALLLQLGNGWRDNESFQLWMGEALRATIAKSNSDVEPIDDRLWVWIESALSSHSGHPLPVQWHGWVATLLQNYPERTARALSRINLEGNSQLPLVHSITKYITSSKDIAIRQQLLACLPPKHLFDEPTVVAQHIDALRDMFESNELGSTARSQHWAMLKRLKIDEPCATRVLELIPQLSANELMQAIEIISCVGSEELDRQLLSQLRSVRSARSLPAGSLVSVYRGRSEPLRNLAQEIADELFKSDPDVNKKVQTILKTLPSGDPVRGLELYHSSKANCGGCHQMGYLGGKIGPELSKIGRSRTREALLEAILFPNERIEQGFQATQVLTIDGRIVNGIPSARPSDQNLELRVSADQVVSIPLEEIEEARPSDISIMPGGMLELLSQQELADLLSLLEAAN